ncbi:DNA-3-methyladenine glycosylase 2 family protein [Nocardia neocaledoniensis]|uniref:DNA-3-methyladenine glycosylase 2 family protein n=1 Tax=Nocardia neocaledoniensis TaxID=236511 RepID=UPI002453B8EC|nr:DNA-3-methyladenine glycosylase 2 family protein [Nocardia neocaledoniensis]
MDFERCYRAVSTRDARFDGQFFTAVRTTGIYCRPSCPALTPKRANVSFLPTAAAAQQAGYRACRRCLPDAAPGSPLWNVRADLAARAMRLIGDGVIERGGVPALAATLGYSSRQLTRVLTTELGAGPLALARAHRAHTARLLIQTTEMSMSDIAFAAGFTSIRQFNDTVREVFAVSPTAMRTETRRSARADVVAPATPGVLTLRLPYREPLDTGWLSWFLSAHTVPGMELWADGVYTRSLRTPHGHATIRLSFQPGHVRTELALRDMRDLAPTVARVRHLLDLDADPAGIDEALGVAGGVGGAAHTALGMAAGDHRRSPGTALESTAAPGGRESGGATLGSTAAGDHASGGAGLESAGSGGGAEVARASDGLRLAPRFDGTLTPGIRVPGCVDGAELLLRTMIGQQISVRAAATHTARLVEALGERIDGPVPLLFPTAAAVAEHGADVLTGPTRRVAAIVSAARAIADGELVLHAGRTADDLRRDLLALDGVGPWTADYVTMRSLADPDVLLGTDLVVRQGAALAGVDLSDTVRWAPWRSYLSMHLWKVALLQRGLISI